MVISYIFHHCNNLLYWLTLKESILMILTNSLTEDGMHLMGFLLGAVSFPSIYEEKITNL
ncbi:hypothetical protein HanIR_Chr15g0774841 [Helianthus annuus]|nr:hypothetical protein HanIR_Chr15g0774841 [Helianthus annuus]